MADPVCPEVGALIAAHLERSRALYPTTSEHSYDVATLKANQVTLYVGRLKDIAVTIGGLRALSPRECEIKSMYTAPFARGKGYGRAMVAHLMAEARAGGHCRILLETGSDPGSAAARRLYQAAGFAFCPRFGDYPDDALSVFMAAEL